MDVITKTLNHWKGVWEVMIIVKTIVVPPPHSPETNAVIVGNGVVKVWT